MAKKQRRTRETESYFDRRLREDPELARLCEEEQQRLEAYYNRGTVVGVLAHPCNINRRP